ncbi:MAG: histidine phosphatase family protein [Firmicutes bacterium]|nr:histidine phosphatase family protein [Bacillota bacterium]
MNSKILMLRHGITEGNKNKWFYGESDLPLISEGIEELNRQKERGIYPEIPKDALFFTSGLGRTAETLNILFGDRDFEEVRDLREINFGVCECKSFDELKDDEAFNSWTYDETGDYQFPQGESRNQFKERVARGFKYVLARHMDLVGKKEAVREESSGTAASDAAMTVVICHGGVITEILYNLFPEEKESRWGWMPQPGCGYILDVIEGRVTNPCLLGKATIY